MIAPRRIIQSSDDSYLLAISKIVGISPEELFFKLESIKNKGTINGFDVIKKNDDDKFSYLITNKEETIRFVCTF